jgi:hypothetical protein
MVKADLKAARKAWIEEVKPEDRPERERSSKLAYQDEQGRYFDFHALRGQFVSSLARAGVHPKVAQQLARHSTIHLTMANYTHLDTADLAGALRTLPPLVGDENHWPKNWPTEVGNEGQKVPSPVKTAERSKKGQETPDPLQDKGSSNACHHFSERRAWDSNPQPVARHLISSQAANHSRTLRNGLRNIILRYVRLAVKGLCARRAQRARKDWCSRIRTIARSPGRQTPLNCPLGNNHAVHPLIVLPDDFGGGPDQKRRFLLRHARHLQAGYGGSAEVVKGEPVLLSFLESP